MVTCAPIACKHKVSGSFSLPSRGPFHLSLTVLFAIGHWVVFRLGGWALPLHTGFHVSGTTLVPSVSLQFSSTGVSPSSLCFSKTFRLTVLNHVRWSSTPRDLSLGLASFPFARRYLGNRCFFLFLELLRCFSSLRFLLSDYLFIWGYLYITTGGFPHSEICGSADICSFPQLIAACHVLLRLPVPRHPPYALSHLTFCLSFLSAAVLLLAHSSVTYLSMLLHRSLTRLASAQKILHKHFHACFQALSFRLLALTTF